MVLTMRLDTVLEGRRRAHLLVRVLPAEDRRGRAPALRGDLAPARARADLRVGHLWRRRLGAHAHRRPGRRGSGVSSTSSRSPTSPASTRPSTICSGILDGLRGAGIDNVLALRGDPPDGDERFVATAGGLAHGNELMELITADYDFCVGGACYPEKHPESADADEDVRSAKRKADAGASYLITNLFFDNRDVLRLCREGAGCRRDRADHPGHHARDQRRPDPPVHAQDRRVRSPSAPRCAAHTRERPRGGAPAGRRLGDPAVRGAARRGRARACTSTR